VSDSRDTQPPPPDDRPSVDDIATMLAAQTARIVGDVGQLIDPVRATLQHLVDDVLHLRHDMMVWRAEHARRIEQLERRVGDLEAEMFDEANGSGG
jgi:hypothetical protein